MNVLEKSTNLTPLLTYKSIRPSSYVRRLISKLLLKICPLSPYLLSSSRIDRYMPPHGFIAMTTDAAAVDSQRIGIISAVAISLTAVWISISLRAWIRVIVTKDLGRDDAFLLGAALLFTGYCLAVLLMMLATNEDVFSVGEDTSTLPNAVISMVVSSFGLYISTMIMLKISLGFFFLRLLTRIWQRWAVMGIVTVNAINGIFVYSSMLFSCGSPERYLNSNTDGTCLPPPTNYALQLQACVINGVTNWVFVILPAILLIRVPMTPLLKICTGLVLLLACCASIVSLVRIGYIKDVKPGPELFITAVNLCITTTAECGLGIAAASAATLRPLFRRLDNPKLDPIVSPSPRTSKPREMIASSFYSTCIDGYYGNADTESQNQTESQHQPSRPEFISRFSEWSTTSATSAHSKSKLHKPNKSAEKAPRIKTPPPHQRLSTPPVPALPPLQYPCPPPMAFQAKIEQLLKCESPKAHPPPTTAAVRKVSGPLNQQQHIAHQQARNDPAAAAPPPEGQPVAPDPATSFDYISDQDRDKIAVELGWV
ncbi:hypothetical protein BST61_g131 [Cercospora zeina]